MTLYVVTENHPNDIFLNTLLLHCYPLLDLADLKRSNDWSQLMVLCEFIILNYHRIIFKYSPIPVFFSALIFPLKHVVTPR